MNLPPDQPPDPASPAAPAPMMLDYASPAVSLRRQYFREIAPALLFGVLICVHSMFLGYMAGTLGGPLQDVADFTGGRDYDYGFAIYACFAAALTGILRIRLSRTSLLPRWWAPFIGAAICFAPAWIVLFDMTAHARFVRLLVDNAGLMIVWATILPPVLGPFMFRAQPLQKIGS